MFVKAFIELVESNDFFWKGDNIQQHLEWFEPLRKDLQTVIRKKWTVRIENPVLGTEQIVQYLARYVRRVAITNTRIEALSDIHVTINYKQYDLQQPGQAPPIGMMEFEGAKFIQRFAQHIPPRGFHKVRYYGIYAFSNKILKSSIYEQLTQSCQLPYQIPTTKTLITRQIGHNPDVCSNCGGIGNFVTILLPAQDNKGYHLTKRKTNMRIRAGPRPVPVHLFG